VEELQPQDLEDLLQDLHEEGGVGESLPPEVEELLRVLQSGTRYYARSDAAEQLGKVGTSSPRIVRALLAAYESDPYRLVRWAAAESLRAPVHQAYIQEHPDLMKATERALQPRPGADRQPPEPERRAPQATERPAPAKPVAHPASFRVETLGDTLRISWKPDLGQRGQSGVVPVLLLLVSILFLLETGFSLIHLLFYALAFGSGYWVLALLANSTRVTAGKDEWIFQQGPFPLPTRRFYLRPRRLDPAACGWVWTHRVEEYKRRWPGSGGSGDGPLGCLLGLVELAVYLSGTNKELVVTYKLYARCVDGGDKELLPLLSEDEAGYLGQKLQQLLEVGGGPQAEE
jgi:hypothetical protein